jgi:hypothetical protein
MKTYRQNLNIWLEEKKNSSENDEVKNVLEEVQKYIKSKEKEESHMVDSSYESGYYDCELKRGFKHNYYKQTYKIHDFIKNMLKLN